MSSRRPPPLEVRRFTPAEAKGWIKLLDTRIGEVKALDPNTVAYNDETVRATARRIATTVLEIFEEHSREYQAHGYHKISGGMPTQIVGYRQDPRVFQQDFAAGIPRTATMLEGLIKTVRERTDSARPATVTIERPQVASHDVFIVHGRKEGPREAVARLVTKLGLNPIILHEQASGGRTIIEKIEHHSDVGFAVVLLTGDDLGGPACYPSTYLRRARQNVIMELGFFVAKLGRGHVCVLHEEASGNGDDQQAIHIQLNLVGKRRTISLTTRRIIWQW